MNALDLLTARLFDYAGMFPPASLSFPEALSEAARIPKLARPGMVATDLAVDGANLRNVTVKALQKAGFGDTLCSVALVGVAQENLRRVIPRVAQFNRSRDGAAAVVSVEVQGKRFDTKRLREAKQRLGDQVRLYVEPQLSERAWPSSGAGLLEMLGRLRDGGVEVGVKVRCSGEHALGNRTLAWLIPEVVRHGIPLKATGGLHHPILEAEAGNDVGFVNLAAALRMHQAFGADEFGPTQILECLHEHDPQAYAFHGELGWRGYGMAEDTLGEVMDELPFAVGACSLREPDDDLARLFGLPATM